MTEYETKNEHRNCLFCGDLHPHSFGLRFTSKEDGAVRATFQSYSELQGYNGIMHGGIIASLLDAAMTNCLFQQGVQAMTADLQIRYKHSVPCNAKLELQAQLIESRSRLYSLKAKLVQDGRVMVRAKARFMQIKNGETEE